MKSLWIRFMLIAILAVAGQYISYAQSPEQLYQKGLIKEEGEGALQEAITMYNQIADNTSAEQSLRAKALLHIGMCYEKMGKQEAIRAYRRLVNSFPAQKNEVAIARERLNRLILTENPAKQDEKEELLIRKILPDTEIEPMGTPSPDGRFISYTDWRCGGNLGILDLETKEKKILTDFKDPNKQVYYSSWAPDGNQIAYFWWQFDQDQYNLSVYDLDKSGSRDLFISDQISWIELGNWSSDCKYIYATLSLNDEPKSQIVRVSATDGSLRLLKTCEESYIGGKPYVSPDNKFLAYNLPDKNAAGNSDIFLLSLDNLEEKALTRHPSHEYILGWSPDGRNILYANDRSGTVDAMLIGVEEGRSSSQPYPVKENIGPIVPMGITRDGSFFYGQWPGADNIYSTEVDIERGTMNTEPGLLIQTFTGRNYSPAYSPDGIYLAYISNRGVMKKGQPGPVLCIRNLLSGEEFEVNPDLQIAGYVSNLNWSPDNRSIAFACNTEDGHSRIFNYDINTKQFSPLVLDPGNQPSTMEYAYPVWSKDGNSLFYIQFSRYSTVTLIKERDMVTGQDKELYRYASDDLMDRLFNYSLSPDGNWIAAINRGDNRMVRLISTAEGDIQELYRFHSPGGFPYSPVWSKDGQFIIFPFQELPDSDFMSREWSLMRISVKGGESNLIRLGTKGISSLTLHPDGKTLAFRTAGTSFPENNIWEMQNFFRPEHNLKVKLAEEPKGIRIKKVWETPLLDYIGTVSYDGKYRSCVDWGVGDVAIHNLETDEIQKLTHEASLGENTHFAENPVISKDGKRIAYSWWNPYNTNDLLFINVDDLSKEHLYKKEGEELYPAAWLSGNELVVTRYFPDARKSQIIICDVQDKTLRVKKEFDRIDGPVSTACSPDERYIAYSYHNEKDNGNLDINLLLANSNEDIPLINHPSNDKVIGWIPGRNVFLFISDRSGTWDLWGVPIDDRNTTGPAKLLYTDLGDVSPMGFTSDGTCYFGFNRRNFYSMLAPFDKETGTIDLGSGETMKGSNYGMTWSPDGGSLAYLRIDNTLHLGIKNLKTAKEMDMSYMKIMPINCSWAPDGKSILVLGMDAIKRGKDGYKGELLLINLETGKTDEIFQLSDYEYNLPEDDAFPLSCLKWDPDGESFFYLFFKDRLVKHDLASGEDRTLYKYSAFTRGVLDQSPDGTRLLFGLAYPGEEMSRLYEIPVEGGNEREICTTQEANGFANAFWSPDGKFIYFVEILHSMQTNLWRVRSTGGEPEKVWSSENRVDIFDIHPEGNQIALSARERKTEVRAIENLENEIDAIFKE